MMRILITAGNAQAPIDQVRCVTNIFTGRTGARIAEEAWHRGHQVTLATSHPETIDSIPRSGQNGGTGSLTVVAFRTFADLEQLLRAEVTAGKHDVVIHSAAVTDFTVADIFARDHRSDPPRLPAKTPAEDESFHRLDAEAGKIKSTHRELWLRLVPTPKLIDQIRRPWGFCGVLVKFKLEVGIEEDQLRAIAIESCRHSDADLIVANTFEGRESAAYFGWPDGTWRKIARADLAHALLNEVESLHASKAGPAREPLRQDG